jgi:pSer/pThr/pTyr-binding forkhead associated (FHA) protein
LDQVSWHHLELDVRDATVTVRELGSSNGTFRPAATAPQPDTADAAEAADATADPALGPEPVILAAGDRLLLAHPTALVLTLEALR